MSKIPPGEPKPTGKLWSGSDWPLAAPSSAGRSPSRPWLAPLKLRGAAMAQWAHYLLRRGPQSPRSHLGGARRDRTDDLMLAKHALSQLSYGPDCLWQALKRRAATSVALARCAEAPRGLNGPVGFVLTNAKGIWWARADSNCRPHAYQACALTT